MATPITSIQQKKVAPEEIKKQKQEELTSLIVEQKEILQKLLEISSELDQAGVVDAAKAMVESRESLVKIAIEQTSKESVKNGINHIGAFAGLLGRLDPALTSQLTRSVERGFQEAELYGQTEEQMGLLDLLKLLNDPDVNRAVKFGAHFLKGMGKGLSEKG